MIRGFSGPVKSLLSLAAIAVSLVLVGVRPALATETRTIVSNGMAAGEDLSAKDMARDDAKRHAVETVCGVMINARSEAEDFQLKRDRILSQAQGYVTAFDPLKEWTDAGISHCQARVTVSLGKFQDDWSAMFEHIKEDMGNPRMVVVITEDNDVDDLVRPKPNGICQSTIENYFLSNKVQLMDKGVVDSVRERDLDVAAINGDEGTLVAKAAAFDADVLVFGRAEAKQGGPVSIGGRTLFRWDITLNVRVVNAMSGALLASNTYQPEKPHLSPTAACGDRAFQELASEVAGKLLYDIGEAWRQGLTSHQIFQLVFKDCSRREFRHDIMPALLKLRGVEQGEEGVKLREAVNDVVTAQIYWSFDLNALADAIEDLEVEGMVFEITQQDANRLHIDVIHGG